VTRSVLTLAVALGLASAAVWVASGLQLDTGLEALLPADSVSVLSIQATRDKLGLEEPLTILVETDDPKRSKAITAKLAETFTQWPETVWVMTSYGLDALAERALYYVDAETLYEWSELAEESLDWEVCKASPLCVTIADPPELPDSDEIRAAVDRSPAGTVLQELTGQSAKQAGSSEDADGDDEGQALCNDAGTVCAVQVMLSGSPGDIGYARMIKERAEAVTVPLVQSEPEGTRIEVIGRYRVAPLPGEAPRTLLPGHLLVADPAAVRRPLVYRTFDLAYQSRNRPILYRLGLIVGHIFGGLVLQDLKLLFTFRVPTMTYTVIYNGTVMALKLSRGVITPEEMATRLHRIFIRYRHRRQYPNRQGRTPLKHGLSLAKDIDTVEEAEEIAQEFSTHST